MLSSNILMLKKIWHLLVALGGGFMTAALIVGGALVNLGWVPEALATRVTLIAMPFTAALCYWLFYVYDGRSEAGKEATRHERRHRPN